MVRTTQTSGWFRHRPQKAEFSASSAKAARDPRRVAPGEVDGELAREVQEECGKFGPVRECIVYEHKDDPSLPEEEIVRTFVAFEKQESAIKAFLDMEGRFFAGRQISCCFFNEDRFAKRDLVPDASEKA